MTTKGRKYFSGKTLDNALLQAARHHGLRPEEVAYRQIEKRHGFLKARKGVLIEVDPDSPRLDSANETPAVSEPAPVVSEPAPAEPVAEEFRAPEVEPEQESEEVSTEPEEATAPEISTEPEEAIAPEAEPEIEPEQVEEPGRFTDSERRSVAEEVADGGIEELIEAAGRGLKEILAFSKLDLEYEVTEGEDQLDIELRGPDRARLLEDRGNLILSIQHLLPRLVRGYTGRSIPCHVDSENYHETRRAELKVLAEEAAIEVKERQRSRTLPPMNPAERRIIHVTLADETEITTESQGRGFFKRVTISPAMRRPRGFDRYSR